MERWFLDFVIRNSQGFEDVLTLLYNSLVRPHLENANLTWNLTDLTRNLFMSALWIALKPFKRNFLGQRCSSPGNILKTALCWKFLENIDLQFRTQFFFEWYNLIFGYIKWRRECWNLLIQLNHKEDKNSLLSYLFPLNHEEQNPGERFPRSLNLQLIYFNY